MATKTVTKTQSRPEPLTVKIADMKISADPTATIITYALGSCIGIAAYDPEVHTGGIVHFMLPEPTTEEAARTRPLAYGHLAIPAFFRALFRAGAKKATLVVKLAGGANMLKATGAFRIGEKNYEIAKKILSKNNVKVAAEDVGDIYGRTLRLELADGTCRVTNPVNKEVEL